VISIVIPLQNEKGEKGEACGERGEAYAGGEFFEKVAHGVPLQCAARRGMGLSIRASSRLVNRACKGWRDLFSGYSQAHQKRIKKRIICASY